MTNAASTLARRHPAPAVRRAGAALLAACSMLALAAPSAHAGSYVVTACGAAPGGVNNSWTPFATHGNVTAYSTVCAPLSSGLIARAAANNSTAPNLAAAGWNIARPNAETVITGIDFSGEMYRTGGDSFNTWGVGLYDDAGGYLWGNATSAFLNVGTVSGSYVPIAVGNRTALTLGVRCANGGGCTTASSGVQEQNYSRARTVLYGARVTFGNWTAPGISGKRGALWTASGWIGGTQAVGFDGTDEVGIRRIAVDIDGQEQASDSGCDYTYVVPCPTSRALDVSFNTGGFSDGVHTMYMRTTDAAGNASADSRPLYIDNTAPAAPATPSLAGAPSAQWRTTNGFTIDYANPATGGGSPNDSSDVQICGASDDGTPDLTSCTTRVGDPAAGTNSFNVAGPGKYRARVRVRDRLYVGQWSDWGPVMRFDDVVPGAAEPQIYNGWLSRDELAAGVAIKISEHSPAPASGIAGFAITRTNSLPGTAVTLPSSLDGRAVINVSTWNDDIYSVQARAVSVAGRAAADRDVVTTQVKIDTTAPDLDVSGAPEAGATVNEPVTLAVSATDSLSGMATAASGQDVTAGAHLSYSLDGSPQTRARSASMRLTTTDGRHTVSVSAVDLAGNRSDAQTFTFTQDTSPPVGGLLPGDPGDPRRLAFFIAEDCIGSATIDLSTDEGRTWRPLTSETGDRLVSARIPDDVWDARIAFTVRARVTDCAGNGATLTQWYGGAADGSQVGSLSLPQRAPVRLVAAFSRLELSSKCLVVSKPRVVRDRSTGRTRIVRRKVKVCPRQAGASAAAKKVYSRARSVYGVLTDAAGRPQVGREVHVQAQPRKTGAQWKTVRVVRTDPSGIVTAAVRKFTSLRVRLIAPRDDTFADAESATLVTNVAARSTISVRSRSLRNGDVMQLHGRVMGGHIPAGGMQIALYGYSPAKRRWLPVRTTVKVDPRGRWTALYRFTATTSRASYRFRVRIAERANFPFSTGYSRTLKVVVRP